MNDPLKLMCILAHPDDEALGLGGTLAKYANEGVEISLLTATRGERGWPGDPEAYPGLSALGKIREQELRCAAAALGIREVILLDYVDGDLDKANPAEAVGKIVQQIRRLRPQVVITFDPFGVYGHPDHIVISQLALAAVTSAASASSGGDTSLPPHTVQKLYFVAETEPWMEAFQTEFGQMGMPVDDETRRPVYWPKWSVSTEIESSQVWDKVMQSLRCHKTQILEPEKFAGLAVKYPSEIWGIRTYYRVFSLVNGGRGKETDLFEGLRHPENVPQE